jgi:hypothetical protein
LAAQKCIDSQGDAVRCGCRAPDDDPAPSPKYARSNIRRFISAVFSHAIINVRQQKAILAQEQYGGTEGPLSAPPVEVRFTSALELPLKRRTKNVP